MINFLYIYIYFFLKYIEMSKDSSAKYYQNNKEILQKMSREKYQSF